MSFTILPDYEVESPEWFTTRAGGVTATDIAKLANGGPAAWAEVKAKKQGAESTFHGNAYTRWGNEREPFIAAHVEFLYGVKHTNRIIRNDADPRRLASPDGLSADRLGEYKTTVNPWEERPDAIPRDYYDQVQWALDVAGFDETVFAWEDNENFTPGAFHHILIPRDEKRLVILRDTFERFMDYLTEDETPGAWDAVIAEAYQAKLRLDEAQAGYDAVMQQVRDRAGESEFAAKSPFGSLSYAMPKPRATFDQTAFKAAHPDLVSEFTKTTPASKPTLRFTPKG
jgi:hypothetical protein